MRIQVMALTALLAVASLVYAAGAPTSNHSDSNPAILSQNSESADAMRVEGERRFRANCGRCHNPPHKFPPRMMATIVRHMRVRATITDEDKRLILFYMTQ